MKKLFMLMLATGFITVAPARAEVGKDKTAPNCQQVIQSIQEQLKKARPQADGQQQPAGTPTNSGTAQ